MYCTYFLPRVGGGSEEGIREVNLGGIFGKSWRRGSREGRGGKVGKREGKRRERRREEWGEDEGSKEKEKIREKEWRYVWGGGEVGD